MLSDVNYLLIVVIILWLQMQHLLRLAFSLSLSSQQYAKTSDMSALGAIFGDGAYLCASVVSKTGEDECTLWFPIPV
jgi:hypothetical protein